MTKLKSNWKEVAALISSCGLLLSLARCGSSPAQVISLTANMNSATKVGRAQSASGTNSSIPNNDFVSIGSSGEVATVFNAPFPIYGIQTTSNYVIISGAFVSQAVIDQNGNPLNCYLYAVSKTAQNLPTDVVCLSSHRVGDYDPSLAANNTHYEHLGFAVRNDRVYFTDGANGILYSWKEGDVTPTQLYSQAIQSGCPGFDDVFLDSGSNNICVLQSAQASCTSGFIYCGTDSSMSAEVTGTPSVPVLAETRQLGAYVVTTTQKVSLSTLATTSRTSNGSNGGLPSGASNVTSDTTGGEIYIAYAGSLAHIDSSGNTCLFATTNGLINTGCSITAQTVPAFYQSLLGLGNYAWTYGTSDLNDPTTGTYLSRINLITNVLDSTNYISNAGMTSISGIFLTADGRIQVTGKNSSGTIVISFIDSSGSISTQGVSVTTMDIIKTL